MRFMRQGFGRVIAHRQPGRASLPNSAEIIDPEWQTWIELRRQARTSTEALSRANERGEDLEK